MKKKAFIFESAKELAETAAKRLVELSNQALRSENFLTIALAGGKTPATFYQLLAQPDIQKTIVWDNVHLFWGDERCVPPDHKDSNYGSFIKFFVPQMPMPQKNIHRIYGENKPAEEIIRYSNEIQSYLDAGYNSLPSFDWIILGLGQDGHTASIFPKTALYPDETGLCAHSQHPQSGQKRITLTLKIINNAKRISFFVTGEEKSQVVAEILNGSPKAKTYPAGRINASGKLVEWYLDQDAAKYLKSESS